LQQQRRSEASDLHIVDIQGTIGASAQIGRTEGLSEAAKTNGWDLLASESGEFTQAKGQEVMESFIKQYKPERCLLRE
jgi:ABC-type sugar transport system substrate-binding protein